MGRYMIRRIGQAILVVVAVALVVFVVTRLIGDPVAVMLPFEATEENRAVLEEQLGLDQPLLAQLGDYMAGAARLDFGDSLWQRRPAADIIFEVLPATLLLAFTGFALALVIGVALGLVASLRPGGFVDRFAVVVGVLGLSLPQFWVGLVLIVVFSVTLGWLPTSGSGGIKHLILPAIVIAGPIVGRISLVTRSAMIDELNAPYVRDATARGLSRSRIVVSHAFRGAAIAVLTIAGWEFVGALAGATVIVETVFAWPGLGFTAFQAIERQDLILLQGVVLVVAVMVVVVNLLVDLAYKRIDPRVRLE